MNLMRPHDYRKDKMHYPCLVSPKMDGMRAYYLFGDFYSRENKKIHGMQHITKELRDKGLGSYVLDGELLIPGMSFEEGVGLIRNHKATPEAVFMLFDLPATSGHFEYRYFTMQNIFGTLEFTKRIHHYKVMNAVELENVYTSSLKQGYEGLVIKTLYHEYQGNRSYDWMKLVPVRTADLTVIGGYGGKGKYTGMLGGFYCVTSEGRDVKVGGGYTDAQRELYYRDIKKYIGWTIEVHYARRTISGSLRHPRFRRFRLDLVK